MRSLSILLLYKNTQEVNSHGLVGGLIGIDKTVKYKGALPENADANTYREMGIWWLNSYVGSKSNFPSSTTGFFKVNSDGENNIFQLIECVPSGKIKKRCTLNTGAWQEWVDI